MTCAKALFHPTGPCCDAEDGHCRKFPRLNWSKIGWKLRQPAALWAEVRYAPRGYPGSPLIVLPGFPGYNYASYVGTIPIYESEPVPGDVVAADVYFGHLQYHMRAGEFLAAYRGSCQWAASCRERLCPDSYELLRIQLPDMGWSVKWRHFTPVEIEWEAIRSALGPTTDPVEGPFVVYAPFQLYGSEYTFINWRHILRAAECEFKPAMQARGLWPVLLVLGDGTRLWQPGGGGSIEGGVLSRLDGAETAIRQPAGRSAFYRPSPMDLAVEWTLSGGIEFGVEADGEFVVYTGGRREITEVITLDVLSTDRQGYPLSLTFVVGRFDIFFPGSLVEESFEPFVGETPEAFAARFVSVVEQKLVGYGANGQMDLRAEVVRVGSRVTITTRTFDADAGGFPMSIEFTDDLLQSVLGLFSVSQSRSVEFVSSPWQLVGRESVSTDFGQVNRFERTDGNDTLPAWVELETVPL